MNRLQRLLKLADLDQHGVRQAQSGQAPEVLHALEVLYALQQQWV